MGASLRSYLQDVLQATIGTDLKALALGDAVIKAESLKFLSEAPERRPRRAIMDAAGPVRETSAFFKQLRPEVGRCRLTL